MNIVMDYSAFTGQSRQDNNMVSVLLQRYSINAIIISETWESIRDGISLKQISRRQPRNKGHGK